MNKKEFKNLTDEEVEDILGEDYENYFDVYLEKENEDD